MQALARFADQITHRTRSAAHWVFAFAKIQQGVDSAAPAQFVVQAGQRHVVALAGQLPLGVHQFFGHDEKRNAFGTGNGFAISPWDFGEHQVDDVLGQLVVAGRNPHFVALEAVTWAQGVAGVVVAIGCGAGGHIGQRRACLRFAQAHGAGKAAIEFIERKHLLLQGTAMLHQKIRVTHGQHASTDADRGTRKKRIRRCLHGVGQLHAADVVVLRGAQHAALHIGVMGVLGADRQDNFFAIEGGFLGVHHSVEGGVFIAGNTLAGV